MNSIKTKQKHFVISETNKAIGGVALVPKENGEFRVYVAWEWPDQARAGFFAVIASIDTYKNISSETINHVADYGDDITHNTELVKSIFPNLIP